VRKLFEGITSDVRFIRDHELQPGWYKILKFFLLLGMMIGYYLIFGPAKTLVFFGCFFGLSLVVHMTYRTKTNKYTQSWLDFRVEEIEGQRVYQRIGIYYYLAVTINGLISLLISQLLIG
jgi:hypothetical protein